MSLYKIFTGIFILMFYSGFSQVYESFSDRELAHQPFWYGDTASWTINSQGQLQSANSIVNSSFQISTVNHRLLYTSWSFYCKMDFNPSSANYIDFFLTASDTALASSGNVGYFVRLGNTDDEISLYRKDAGTNVKLIDGFNSSLNAASSELRVRVTRDSAGTWTLERRMLLRDSIWYFEGSALDTTYMQSAYSGILVKQSTTSFFNKHFLDDIYISQIIPDTTAPRVTKIELISSDSLMINFSKVMDSTSAANTLHYQVNLGIGFPAAVKKLSADCFVLHFLQDIPVRTNYLLRLSNILDLRGNQLADTEIVFYRYVPQRFDVLIDEIMADPSPPISLPETEWLELFNNSGMDIHLKGWRLGKGNAMSGAMPDIVLPADSFLLIAGTGSLAMMANYGRALSVTNFPVLSNDADEIFLRADNGVLVHAVGYDYSWYRNEVKSAGGWSLEMVDKDFPCAGAENWQASTCPVGGTPGRQNSISVVITDHQAPKVLTSYVVDSFTICVEFNETLDSITATNTLHFQLDHSLSIIEANPEAPLFKKMYLKLNSPMISTEAYQMRLSGLADCAGNFISDVMVGFGLPQAPDSMDLVINEILFDPPTGGSDFVEIFNNSNKVVDLKNILLARRDLLGHIIDFLPASLSFEQILPGEYRVLTENKELLMIQHFAPHPSWVLEIPSLPTMPDDEGSIILLNHAGRILDEVHYTDDWHFALINNKEDVSLERVSPDLSGNDRNNWHSASSVSGFATPTARNSQQNNTESSESIFVEPKVFSPNNDGHDDYLNIHYTLKNGETVMNISVFDISGKKLRQIAQQALTGNIGTFSWDGTDERGRLLSEGAYIILTESFDLTGKVKRKKTAVGLVRR